MSSNSRLESSESCSSESPIPEGSEAAESEQARDSECSIRSESSLSPGITRGYNSEDYYRGKLQFDRFAIKHVPKNLINHSKLVLYIEEFSIPLKVGLRIPNEGGAIHSAFMELGASPSTLPPTLPKRHRVGPCLNQSQRLASPDRYVVPVESPGD
ncbi:hypothetical protein ACOSQ2_009951 [Xanthoceras sorbifolium]